MVKNLKRAPTANAAPSKKEAQRKQNRRRKSLDMFAINKQIRNSAEASMIGALESILFEGMSKNEE